MKLENLKAGDVLSFWHDAGCTGHELAFAKVLKVGAKMVRVVDEHGTQAWRYPHFFARIVSPNRVAGMRAEGSLKL